MRSLFKCHTLALDTSTSSSASTVEATLLYSDACSKCENIGIGNKLIASKMRCPFENKNKQSICKFIHPIFRARLDISRLQQLLFLKIVLNLRLLVVVMMLLLLLLTHFEKLV
jgi:hypothetical protein